MAPQFHTLVIETLDRAPSLTKTTRFPSVTGEAAVLSLNKLDKSVLRDPLIFPRKVPFPCSHPQTHCQNGGTRLRILRNFVGRHEHPPPAHHWRTLPHTRKLDLPTDRLVFGHAEVSWRVPVPTKFPFGPDAWGHSPAKTRLTGKNIIKFGSTFDHKPIITEKQTTKLIDGQTGQKKTSLLN